VACLSLISLFKFWNLSNKNKHNIWSQKAYILNYLADVSINFTFLHQGILWPAEVVNNTLDVSSILNHPEPLFSLASKPPIQPTFDYFSVSFWALSRPPDIPVSKAQSSSLLILSSTLDCLVHVFSAHLSTDALAIIFILSSRCSS